MVEHCRSAYPDGTFAVGDLRDLSAQGDGSYDAIVASYAVLDVLGMITYISPSPCALLDSPEADVIGTSGLSLVEPVDGTGRFATPEDYARSFIEGSPMALAVGELSAEQRDALLHEIAVTIRQRFGEPVSAPMATNIAVAHA